METPESQDQAAKQVMTTAPHDRTAERLAYLAFGGFLLIAGGVFWFGIPKDQVGVAILTTLVNQGYSLVKDAFAVFTGASSPSQSAAR